METRVLTLFDDEEFFPKEQPKEKPKKEKTPKATTALLEEESLSEKEDPASEPITANTEENQIVPDINEDPIIESLPIEKETISFGIHKELPADLSDGEPEIIIAEKAGNDVDPESEIISEDNIEEPENESDTDPEEPSVAGEGVETKHDNEETTTLQTESSEDATAISEEESAIINDNIEAHIPASLAEADEHEIESQLETENDEYSIGEDLNTSLEETVVSEEEIDTEEKEATVKPPTESDKELSKQILSELIQLDYTALIQKDYSFDLSKSTVVSKKLPKRKEPIPQEPTNVEEEEETEEVFEDVTPLPEWNLDKKYYTIGEVAQLFEVNTSHIRFWTNEFKLKPRTTRKGDRLYSPKDIAELRLIHHLVKVKKHTIKGAREKLKSEKSGVNNKLDLKESLVQLKDTLLKIREQL